MVETMFLLARHTSDDAKCGEGAGRGVVAAVAFGELTQAPDLTSLGPPVLTCIRSSLLFLSLLLFFFTAPRASQFPIPNSLFTPIQYRQDECNHSRGR